MKFDCVVGNPPFTLGTGPTKNSYFYMKFIKLANQLSDITAFVIPASYFGSAKRFAGVRVHKHLGDDVFDVYTTTCYYITEPGCTHLVNHSVASDSFARIRSTYPCGYAVNTGTLQLRDCTGGPVKVIWRSNASGNTELDFAYTTDDNIDQLFGIGHHKAVLTLRVHPKIGKVNYGPPDLGCGASAVAALFDTELEARNMVAYLRTKFANAMLMSARRVCGGKAHNSRGSFRMLPRVDLTRTWSDAQLYEYFGLTADEIKLIEA